MWEDEELIGSVQWKSRRWSKKNPGLVGLDKMVENDDDNGVWLDDAAGTVRALR